MAALARTNSTFVAPAPRAIGAPNMSLEHDHRQKHPGTLYTDHNRTHFNTPNGVVQVPQPLRFASEEWKHAQFAQKKIEAFANGQELTPAQIKRAKQAIAKTAKSYNDKQLADLQIAEENARTDILRKQIRKDKKKQRMLLVKQAKLAEENAQLTNEANQLYEQCEKLQIAPELLPDDTDQSVIQKCQTALTEYMNRPLSQDEIKARDSAAAQQLTLITASARSKEIFRDVKTHIVAADQQVEGEDTPLPKKKKKNNKKKQSTKPPPSTLPDVKIDWGPEVKMGEKLSKKQRREIAASNKAADSAWSRYPTTPHTHTHTTHTPQKTQKNTKKTKKHKKKTKKHPKKKILFYI